MRYAPGSFSKNFAWHRTGLRRLHDVIRAGFRDSLRSVSREQWRNDSGIDDPFLELIPINFFMHNKDGAMSVDELVYQSVARPHTIRFDRLALFALHLNRVGHGPRVVERPAMWANEFVRERLWSAEVWHESALPNASIDPFIEDRMAAQRDVRIKCRNNYRHLFELCEYWPTTLSLINSGAEQWISSALFLAWDRFILERGSPRRQALLDLISHEEIHKLLGVSETYALQHAESITDLYLSVGNIGRFSDPESILEPAEIPEENKTDWIDQDESDKIVERRAIEVQAQVRDRKKAAALKQHYDNTCMFCGIRLQIAPVRFYSEAAHIKPLGKPHSGPDKASNMLVLCPNHHLQFDRGILTLRLRGGDYEILSKVGDDPLHHAKLTLRHEIDSDFVSWHHKWFASRLD